MANWTSDPTDTSGTLRGRPLRYLLVEIMSEHERPLTVPQLIAACRAQGVVFDGRASKLVSDALRWEVRRGRVAKVRRGVYAFASAPRSTRYWIFVRVDRIRRQLRWAASQRQLREAAELCDDLPAWWSTLIHPEPLRQ